MLSVPQRTSRVIKQKIQTACLPVWRKAIRRLIPVIQHVTLNDNSAEITMEFAPNNGSNADDIPEI